MFITQFLNGYTDVKFVIHEPMYFHELNVNKIYDIFTLNIEIDEFGNPITIIHMPTDSIEYKVFIQDFLNMNYRSYNNLLKSHKSIGRGIYIKRAKDSWDLLSKLKHTPSSIGYVSPFIYVNVGGEDGLRIINIDTDIR